jgi:hypothetical protein
MTNMKVVILIIFFLNRALFAQDKVNYRLVDEFTLSGLQVKAYFNDPLEQLMIKYPKFAKKSDDQKNNLLLDYELNHPLYCFVVVDTNQVNTSYVVHGDPAKINTSLHYKLIVSDVNAIDNPAFSVSKVIDKLGVMGEFFEHMKIFQGLEHIPDGTKIWGYFTCIHPYEEVKKGVIYQIKVHRNIN